MQNFMLPSRGFAENVMYVSMSAILLHKDGQLIRVSARVFTENVVFREIFSAKSDIKNKNSGK
jgi:hypothetical protein